MDASARLQKAATRSCSEGGAVARSRALHMAPQVTTHRNRKGDDGSPRQRRITVASYMPPRSQDQHGNSSEKGTEQQPAVKTLRDLNTDEVCQWFSNIGLQKCLPFIREAGLRGSDIASVDAKTLDLLRVSTVEDKELLLSAIYKELHPPSSISQRVDSLLETLGPNSVERFTAALVSMSKSRSSPHVSCLNMNRSSLKLRNKSQSFMTQRSPQLIEITINASERIVHLRTPKDTTVGKVKESCIRMLGMTEDKDLFILKDKQGASEDLTPDRPIGSLLILAPENRQLELHLCKKEKPLLGVDSQELPNVNSCLENGQQNGQVNQPAKEEKIRELNQQVDSLQNVILQVQELHHGLVAFCSELKSMEGEAEVAGLGTAQLEHKLELVERQLRDKRQSLHSLRENISNAVAHKNKKLEVRLLDKMKLNCEVFKEEISLVHLNRQMSHLENALQGSHQKRRSQSECSAALGALGQLVSPQCPAMLLVVVQESCGADGRYSFTCRRTDEGSGLVVVQVAGNSHLCLDDRLVEVNGFPVVNSTEEELSNLLLQGPSSVPIVVLRRPPHGPPSRQHPGPQHSVIMTDPEKKKDAAPSPPPQRERMAI